LLAGVEWSGADVFRTTFERMDKLDLSSRVLPGWYDIDTVEDLRQAIQDTTAESNLSRWAERPESLDFLNAG
jgi:glycosyltransferase A (GT-A) superfamily protein (DUF2064 family)